MEVLGAGGAGEEEDVVDGFGVGGVPVEAFRGMAIGEDGIAQMVEADVRDGDAMADGGAEFLFARQGESARCGARRPER